MLDSLSCSITSISFLGGFEDSRGVIRIRKSEKNRKHNGKKKREKRTNNDLQNTTQNHINYFIKYLNCQNFTHTHTHTKVTRGSMSQVVGLPNNSYKPITNTAWVRARLCNLQKRCTRLAAASDKVYQLLAHGRWFSPGTPATSTTKTGRHDIAEILLKVA